MDRSRNRLFLSGTGRTSMFGIQQKLKMLQKSSNVKMEENVVDSDNNNEGDEKMNGTNNNGDEIDVKDEDVRLEYCEDNGYEREEGGEEEGEEEGDGGGYDDEEEYARELLTQQYQQQQGMMMVGGGDGEQEDGGGEEDGGEQFGGEEEDEYDYPDISEFVQTEFDGGCEDDEEDRGLPPADMRSMPQAGYYDPTDEDQDETTNSLLSSLPAGTFIQQTKRSSSSPSSSSARTSTTLNNLLLLRNTTSSTSRKNAAAAQALSNALMLMEQQQQLDDENDEQQEYYGSNGVPLSLIMQQQQAPVKRQQMNKPRNFRAQPLSTSALLEQLQSPAYSKPNILSRKLMGTNGVQNLSRTDPFQSGSRPPPRLQPRPNANGQQRAIQQQTQQISLESLLRKASSNSSSKPMPRLQTLSPTQKSSSRSQNFIVDGRKLSFKTAANNQMRQQKSPTRSLESLMLSHQKSTQLQQQLASGRMRGDGIMVGNLHIRQVSQPVVRNNGNSLLRGSITAGQGGQKNVPRCHVCRKTFATNQVLSRHIASVHGIVFGDVDVGKLGGSVAQLQQQQKNDTANGAHRCRVCYRTFGSLESLRAHAQSHEGEFKCRACRRGFPSWEILEQHEATHKKYECRWCEKYFMNSGNLKAHERIHTGERPYKCADCPKGFKQLGGLQYHLKTNPTHRPQKYKLEDQDSQQTQQQSNSPQDYSTSSTLLLQQDMYGEDGSGDGEGSYMEEDDQEGYLDLATASVN